MNFNSISVQELAQILAEGKSDVQLIDVREETEAEIAFIPQFKLLPLSKYEQWSSKIKEEFKPELETIVICHHGIRSANMCQWLTAQGFENVKNVIGGIDAYSLYIDNSIPRY